MLKTHPGVHLSLHALPVDTQPHSAQDSMPLKASTCLAARERKSVTAPPVMANVARWSAVMAAGSAIHQSCMTTTYHQQTVGVRCLSLIAAALCIYDSRSNYAWTGPCYSSQLTR